MQFLFHGTTLDSADNILSAGIQLCFCNQNCDFGRGFYTTPDYNFAEATARLKTDRLNGFNNITKFQPAVVTVAFDFREIRGLSYLEFDLPDKKWCEFVINNRRGIEYINNWGKTFHNLDERYDIINGMTADGNITSIMRVNKENRTEITDVLVKDLLPKRHMTWGTQISFHTPKGISCIKLFKRDIINS